MVHSKTKRVVFPSTSHYAMQHGITELVNSIRPTLGPRPRITAIQQATANRSPELLDSGGTIARRIIQIQDKDADIGAMYLRQVLWNLQEKVGDGTATAAILFEDIYKRGLHYLTYGGNALRLRYFLDEGLQLIVNELSSMKTSVEGKEILAGIARTVCFDDDLSMLLGEIMDIVGPYGHVAIRTSHGRKLEREYVEGMYLEGQILSRAMIIEPGNQKAEMTDAWILVTDLDIEEPRTLVPVLEIAIKAGARAVLILSKSMSDQSAGLLVVASKDPKKFRVIGAKFNVLQAEKLIALVNDLAILTGGRAILKEAGNTLEGVKEVDFGKARQVWADNTYFGIVGAKGDPRQLRTHIQSLQAAYREMKDAETREFLQQRIGRLKGGSATLWIGAYTETEINIRKEFAERTVKAMRGALLDGVIPGGGSALLACQTSLQQKMKQAIDEDERAAYRILNKAMEAPIRTLLVNAGYDDNEVLPEIRKAGPGYGYDLLKGQIVNMADAKIYDITKVVMTALQSAISGAALALTVDVLVHHKQLKPSIKP